MADSWIGPNVMIHLMMKISVVFSKKGKKRKMGNKEKRKKGKKEKRKKGKKEKGKKGKIKIRGIYLLFLLVFGILVFGFNFAVILISNSTINQVNVFRLSIVIHPFRIF